MSEIKLPLHLERRVSMNRAPLYRRRRRVALGVAVSAVVVTLAALDMPRDLNGIEPRIVQRAGANSNHHAPNLEVAAPIASTVDVPVRLDVMLLRRIGGCESSGRPDGELRWTAPNNYGSSASGAFQFIDSTWRAMAKRYRPDVAHLYPRALHAPADVQIDVALGTLNEYGPWGSNTWGASKHCWRSR